MSLSIDLLVKKPSPTYEFPKQELYVRIEAPKGELGVFLIGDQNGFPQLNLSSIISTHKQKHVTRRHDTTYSSYPHYYGFMILQLMVLNCRHNIPIAELFVTAIACN